jgi:hypothetical protein
VPKEKYQTCFIESIDLTLMNPARGKLDMMAGCSPIHRDPCGLKKEAKPVSFMSFCSHDKEGAHYGNHHSRFRNVRTFP